MRQVGIALALCVSLLGQPCSAAEKERRVFAPAGPWVMNYAENSCQLVRNFEVGEDQMTVAFERFEIGPATRLGLAGTSLRAWSRATQARFRYLPEGDERESELLRTQLSDGRETYLISSAAFLAPEQGQAIMKNWQGAASLAEFDREDLAAAAQTTSIIISEGFRDEPELLLGPMGDAVKLMQGCTFDLVKSWGVDPLAVAAMSRPPKPIDRPSTWLNINDFPSPLRRAGLGGVVQVRLIVDPAGRVDDCRVETEEPGEFEIAVCDALRARARFTPALDADGQPMRTYWRQGVRLAAS
jgi:hypothetical protein